MSCLAAVRQYFRHELRRAIGERGSRLSRGARLAGCYMSTGEGSLSQYHLEGGCDILYQIGAGREKELRRALSVPAEPRHQRSPYCFILRQSVTVLMFSAS